MPTTNGVWTSMPERRLVRPVWTALDGAGSGGETQGEVIARLPLSPIQCN